MKLSPEEKARKIASCKYLELTERYDSMVNVINSVWQSSDGLLSDDERNLISSAYKHVVRERKNGILKLRAIEDPNPVIKELILQIQSELYEYCTRISSLIKDKVFDSRIEEALLAGTTIPSIEYLVFFYKLYADHHRYMAEFVESSADLETYKSVCSQYYGKAAALAERLPVNNTLRLSVALNYSVFMHDILEQHKHAYDYGRKSYEQALLRIESISSKECRETALIMQLIRDNCTIWASSTAG